MIEAVAYFNMLFEELFELVEQADIDSLKLRIDANQISI